MSSCTERLKNGIITENPTFVMMLGMCPTLAVTSSAINGLGMGLTTTAVLILSNAFISLLRKVIPDKVREVVLYLIISSFLRIIILHSSYLHPEHSLCSHSLRHCRINSRCLLQQMLRQMIQISPVAVTVQAV